MHIPGRSSHRHMKGRQIALTLYLPPRKYWLLKSLSHGAGVSMQFLLRRAVDAVLADEHRKLPSVPLRQDFGAGDGSGAEALLDEEIVIEQAPQDRHLTPGR